MKFLVSQLTYLLGEREMQRNLRTLLSFVGVMIATIVFYSIVFHLLMAHEGQQHSWLTGFYWTLTVMSTLGFGDITFHSDLGRLFSILVLISGIVLLLIVLPFTFIRFFYAPWLEAQMNLRAPRRAPDHVRDHVIICGFDEVARVLIPRLDEFRVPYYVIEPSPPTAAVLSADGFSVVTGARGASATYEALQAHQARLIFANLGDADNTNVTMAAREIAPEVPIVALAEEMDSVDVLELSGATVVLPLKHRLGEHLANRVAVGTAQAHRVGHFEDLVIAEFPIHNTMLPGRTVRDTRLRELTGLNVVGVWERGKLLPAGPETLLTEHSVPVIVGTEEQLMELDALFVIYTANENPVVVIGGGKVGEAAARALRRRDVAVSMIEKDPLLEPRISSFAEQVVIGDASDIEVVKKAGILETPSVVLSTNDDAMNIFLAVYVRRLNPEARIVSRITHEWNLEAIHRAGADFALSYGSLAVKSLLSQIQGREAVILGEGADLFIDRIPPALAGKVLADTGIGAKTGLNVIAVRHAGTSITNPAPGTELPAGGELVMLGTAEQHATFVKQYT